MENELQPLAAALEALYGKASAAGFGSAVFHGPVAAGTTTASEAMRVYQAFLGDKWGSREAAWKQGWKKGFELPGGGTTTVASALGSISDPTLKQSAPLLTSLMEDPTAAAGALAAAYDRPDVQSVGLYGIGDGEALSGVILTGLYQSGYAISVVALMD